MQHAAHACDATQLANHAAHPARMQYAAHACDAAQLANHAAHPVRMQHAAHACDAAQLASHAACPACMQHAAHACDATQLANHAAHPARMWHAGMQHTWTGREAAPDCVDLGARALHAICARRLRPFNVALPATTLPVGLHAVCLEPAA
eukprot:357500-Chlamydomonas_euryale.AAC.11